MLLRTPPSCPQDPVPSSDRADLLRAAQPATKSRLPRLDARYLPGRPSSRV